MANKPIIYIDSCCFIDVVKQKVGALPSNGNDDVWFTQKLLEAHQAGDVKLITSYLTIAECVSIEKGLANVPREIQQHFRNLLSSGQYVVLAQQTPHTSVIAQNLRWQHNLVLRGADALHLAAAIENDAQEFLTTDERLKSSKLSEAVIKLNSIGLGLIKPSQTGCLSGDYLQSDMLNA